MALILQISSQLNLHTRCENQVANEIYRGPLFGGESLAVADFKRRYPGALHRPVGPSRKYNCHGLSFASRRTVIWKSSEVAKILSDDDYIQISEIKDVLPGDIVAYTEPRTGDIEHSGIVVEIGEFHVPIILSKWGFCQEVVHKVAECPYDSSDVRYFRITS